MHLDLQLCGWQLGAVGGLQLGQLESLAGVTAPQLISGMCCIWLHRNNNFCDLLDGGLQAGYSLLTC